jgi:hypothetical protein
LTQWQARKAGAHHDRVCKDLTTCTDTEWETKAAGLANDRECKSHTVCTSTQFENRSAGTHQDRVCVDHTVCTETQWEARAAGTHHDRACKQHTVCHGLSGYFGKEWHASQWETKAAGTHHDRECVDHTTCTQTQWETKAAGTHHDRECTDHTTCTQKQWETKAAATHHDRECKAHTTCTQTQWQTKAAETHSDRECADHTTCDYDNEWESTEEGTHNDRVCTALTKCEYSEQWRSTDKTSTSDRICSPLTTCDFENQYESEAKTDTSDRYCTPLTVCAPGYRETVAKTFVTDRECGLCPDSTYKSQTGNDRQCKPCPTGMVSLPSRIMCKVQSCSHIFCRHEVHSCLFGHRQEYRAGSQFHHVPHGNCHGRVWQSIRVYHDAIETNCRDGHRCAMGLVSGDLHKCECEPAPKLVLPSMRTITSPVSRALYGASAMKLQALELSARTKVCLNKGDVATVTVGYRAGNKEPTQALAFKLDFDPRFFAVLNVTMSANPGCGLSGLSSTANALTFDAETFVPYTCVSLTGSKIVPSKDDHVLRVALRAVGKFEGVTPVSVVANPHVHGNGYKYVVAPPIRLRHGHCEP